MTDMVNKEETVTEEAGEVGAGGAGGEQITQTTLRGLNLFPRCSGRLLNR